MEQQEPEPLTQLYQGFDGIMFALRAEDYRLRVRIGLVGIREIKEQLEFEQSPAEGNA